MNTSFDDKTSSPRSSAATPEHLSRAEKMRLMGEMASGVVHDFNNILGAIVGRVQLTLQKSDLNEIRKNLDQIEKIALQGGETVKRLQAFTRRESQSKFGTVDLNEVVAEALEVTRHRWEAQAQEQGIAFTIERESAPQVNVMGVRSELIDVVANLIFNALDAMPDGGRLEITTHASDGRSRLRVTDSGVGMSPDQIEMVFYPFYTTKGSQGTGLGLAVAYGVVSRHGGEIRAESRVGEGTAIIVDLPTTGKRRKARAQIETATMSDQRRVLLVDDDHTILDVMGEALREVGHEVVTMDNGGAALTALDTEHFDVVVTDLGMPAVTGWEVARRARSLKCPVPVIVISGWGAQLDDSGHEVDAVLAKPFHLDQLRNAIVRVTGAAVNVLSD